MMINHHAKLIFDICNELPYKLNGPVDLTDAQEAAEHLRCIHDAVSAYTIKFLREFNSNVPVTETIDVNAYAARFSDMLTETITGPLMDLSERLLEDA